MPSRFMTSKRCEFQKAFRWKATFTFAVAAVCWLAGITRASSNEAENEAIKKEALAWLDDFASRQVLFHADDVKKLKTRVEAMSPEEAATWWEEKAPQRKALSSPEWLETENWLRKFLDVQAIYSDDDIRQFQAEAATDAKESGESLEKILERVTQARLNLSAASASAAQVRRSQVAAVEAFRKDQVKQREAARRQARAPSPAAPVTQPPVTQRRRTRFSEPLVDSMDMARWTVLREIYPRW
jgi:hypothetical protein